MQSAESSSRPRSSLFARFPSLEGIAYDVPEHIVDPLPSRYWSRNYVVLDFEVDTSHGDFGHPVHPANQLLLACWRNGPDHPRPGRYSHWGGEYNQGRLIEDILQADFIVAHNAKYELGWLKRCGLDIMNVLVFDTKLAEFVLSGNLASSHNFGTSLDACCKRRGLKGKDPVIDKLMKAGINPVRMPRRWLRQRCDRDVSETELLFLDQLDQLLHRGQLQVLYTRCLLTPVLAEIEANGMQLDPERVAAAYQEAQQQLVEASNELQAMAPINWNSPQQVADFIYDELGFEELKNRKGEPIRTETGKRKADAGTLGQIKAKTAEQKAFISAYRSLNKASAAISKNLEFFKAACDKQGGRIHAEFNQTVVATHRLSSSGIAVDGFKAQFQNLPNRYKPLFRARNEGWYLCEWDGSGLEFRGAGLLARDEMIAKDINEGRDPHAFSGAVINGITYEEFMERKAAKDDKVLGWRKKAKAHTFKPLFGGQSGSAAEKRYYEAFKKRYSGLEKAQTAWSYQALRSKQLRTPWGLIFFFPEATMDRSGYINVKTKTFNYPIQSISTAEMIPLAVVFFAHLVYAHNLQDKILLVNTVHDSVISEVHPDFLEEYKEFARQAWLYVYWYFSERYKFPLEGLPLGTEITWGSHWSEGEDEAFNIHQDGRIEKL